MNKKLLLFIALFLLASSYIFAGNTGKISGRVKDSGTGEALPGINLIVAGTSFGAASDENGNFMINNLQPGVYSIITSGVGYQKKEYTSVKVSADFTTRLDIEMAESALTLETIIVKAEAPMVRKDLTSSQAIVDASQIESLPVENINQILTLQAGITQGAGGELHIKGGRSSEISYTVNGVSVSNPYDNSRSVQISTNAIQELSVVSGTFNAEYGNALSGIVNSITREGQNKYSGSVSFYSGDYLSSHKDPFFNIDKVDVLNNYVGELSLGGPIPFFKEYLSFFVSGRYNNNKGYLYGVKQHSVSDNIKYQNTDSMLVMATGNGQIVSMNPSKDISTTAKLTFKPASTIKINYDMLYSNSDYQLYNHNLKYNPDASYQHKEYGLLNSLELKHMPSNSTFYSLKASYNINNSRQYLYPLLDGSGNEVDYNAGMDLTGLHPDTRYQKRSLLQPIASNTFVSGGTSNYHYYQRSTTAALKFDLTSQLNLNHELKTGAEFKSDKLYYENFEVIRDTANPYIASVTSSAHDKYSKSPVEFSAYVQDKMEYENIILNIGVRYDYFNADSKYSVNSNYPSPNNPTLPSGVDKSTLLKDSPAKHQISPRIGISFPITDKGIIHFSYGHFFQIPPFRYLYTNPDFKYEASGTPVFGNANLNPEKTITYEIGLQQQLEDNLAFDVTCFVKDVRDLLALQEIRTSSSQSYQIYVNKDYANIKGVTISLNKRRNLEEFFGASINYTYQSTEGSDTRSDAAFLDLASGRQSEKVPYSLAWDQPHNLNATVNFGYRDSWNITLVGRLGAGLPYTPQLIESQINLKTNSSRKPSQISVDLLADKKFNLFGFNLTVFFKIFNLLDNLIENDVFDDTGRATYTLEKERGTTALADRYASMNSLIKPSSEYFVRPDYYLAPREVRFGMSLDF